MNEVETSPPHDRTRELALIGKTYKISPVGYESLYITINDRDGAPYELLIQTDHPEHYQWLSSLSRLVSAIFRKGGEYKFIIEELKAIHCPKSGYFAKGIGYVPSIVAHIGYILEVHVNGNS